MQTLLSIKKCPKGGEENLFSGIRALYTASRFASFYYTDWTGKRKQKKKKGFAPRKGALEYERGF